MNDNNSEPRMTRHQSAIWLMIVLTGSVFLIELLVMLFMEMLPSMSKMATFLLDSALLSMLIFPIFYFLVFRPLLQNISELRRAEDDLRTASVAFESKDPILITDADARILKANKRFLYFSGYILEEIIGKNPRMFQSGRYNKNYYKELWKRLLRDGSWAGEICIKDKQGHDLLIESVITAVKNEQQETTHYVAVYNL